MKNWRLNLILCIFVLFMAAMISRLFYLQIYKGDFYDALARGQYNIFTEITGQRGNIYAQDKDGNLVTLATNKDEQYVYASPAEVSDKEYVAEILSQILHISREDAFAKFSNEESLYRVIKERLSAEEIAAIETIGLDGIYLQKQTTRYFLQDDSAAHVLGFVGAEGVGQYGIEGNYDNILRGKNSVVREEKGFQGTWIVADLLRGLHEQEGSDVILNIDTNIQFFAEDLLRKAAHDLKIEEGTIIVMDPKSGAIYALANYPSFNPNQYFLEDDLSIFQDAAIQKLYEPGSIFKPFTIAAALDKKKITPDTKYVDEGIVQVGGYAVYNYGNRVWGERTMTEVLEKSINTGAVFAERQLGHNSFLQYLDKFGFSETTGIDLQGEIFSENRNLKNGHEINFTTAAFGQGVEVTPIQIVKAFSALVNGGLLPEPHIVEKIIKPDNTAVETKHELVDRVISQETSAKLTAMLVRVVENGFGKAAQVPGYYVGGKTGTAQISWAALGVQRSGYSDKTIQSFVGFAPAFDPKFIILVKLNNPQTKTAEYSAVPVFRELAKYILDYWEVPPDHAEEPKLNTRVSL